MYAETIKEPHNSLLAALPESEYQLLVESLQFISLDRGQILYRWGEPISSVYFPLQGITSLVSTVESGSTTEVGIVGSEGMVGLSVFLGRKLAREHAIVQISGSAMKLNATIFKARVNQSRELQRKLLLYTQLLFTQISHTATYNSLYPIQARVARWLLIIQDLTQLNRLPLTQEYISLMLGVRRATITEVAISLSKAGIISYSRGQIAILNRQALENKAGNTYSFFKKDLDRFLCS